MAWMEHGLQISLKRYALSVQDKMVARDFECATNTGNLYLLIFHENVKIVSYLVTKIRIKLLLDEMAPLNMK